MEFTNIFETESYVNTEQHQLIAFSNIINNNKFKL